MKIKQLIKGLSQVKLHGNRELEIKGLSTDSRTTAMGDLFIARKGEKFDASQFIRQALSAGAVAIVTDLYDPFIEVTQLICEQPGQIEAKLAARFYRDPSKELFVVGATGSKGKTTTSYLIRHLLEGLGQSCGLISTVETILKKDRTASSFTTHEPIYNQKILREMASQGCKAAVLEVSSHGLALNRTDEIEFDIGLFTNLYPDHLDFHGRLEDYAAAKKKLFSQVKTQAIFNADSEWSLFMQKECKVPIFTYGIENTADLMALDLEFSLKESSFTVRFQNQTARCQTALIGRHNVYNLLAALSVGLHLKASLEEMIAVLSTFKTVPGRLERVESNRGFEIFVDFAHTGEALENVLRSLKDSRPNRILVVFGCGGNRDPSRRKNMAAAAERYADVSIVTSDNPRNEPPEEIIRQVLLGFERPQEVVVEIDRRKAIEAALRLAKHGDIVLIAGKGHEKTQVFAHQTVVFDDAAVVKEILQTETPCDILADS